MTNETYKKLLKLRKSKTVKLSPNPYLKPEIVLRYYQVLGVVHMFAIKRFVLGDDTGTGKCVLGDTLLTTSRGNIKITDKALWSSQEKVENTFYKMPNRGVRIASGKGYKKTEKTFYGGIKPTIKFKTKLGLQAQCTQNHAWKVMDKSGNLIWKKTKDLKIGDFVAVGRGDNLWGYKNLDKNLAWLLGYIVGDGLTRIYRDGHGGSLTITCTDERIKDKLLSVTKKFFKNPKIRKNAPRQEGYKPQYSIWESGYKNIISFMKKYNLTDGVASQKNIPKVVKESNKGTVCAFIQGLFDSDGYVDKDGNLSICLASKSIIEELQLIFLNMGIISIKQEKYNKKYKKTYYSLYITDFKSRKKFFNYINFSLESKRVRLRSVVYKERKRAVTYDIIPYQRDRIKQIRKIIPRRLKWVFKEATNCGVRESNLTYNQVTKLLSFEHESFFKESESYQELKEIRSNNYFYTPIVQIEDGGNQEVFDLEVPDGNTYLANGMVSHNTVQTIGTYTTLLNKDKDKNQKLLVVCPSSAMYQWASEFDKFCNGIKTQIVESVNVKTVDSSGKKITLKSFDARQHMLDEFKKEDKHVLIFNYNTLCTDYHMYKELLENNNFMLVFDEATAFKNPKTKIFKYAKEAANICDRVYGLSATIVKNHLIEAFSIYKVVLPSLFATETSFKKHYCIMKKVQLWKGKGKRGRVINKIVGYKNLDYFKKVIDPYFLGRKKSQISDELPEITSKEVVIRMNDKQQRIYDDALKGFLDFDSFGNKFIKNFLEEVADEEDDADKIKNIDKLTALIYCQQICNSPPILEMEAPSSKEEALFDLLGNELMGEKVVIYTRFKKMVDRLESLVSKNLKVKCTKITGDVGNQQREENKKEFNTSEDCNIMLINSAAKEAVNLQSSGYLIFYELPYSYGDFLQIIGRIHRLGSPHEKITLIYLMCKGTIDEKVYKILLSKKDLFDKILGDSAVGALKVPTSTVEQDLFTDMLEDARKL